MRLMVAEVMLHDGQNTHMVEIFQKYILKNKHAVLTWALFVQIAVSFLISLSAYIEGRPCRPLKNPLTLLLKGLFGLRSKVLG